MIRIGHLVLDLKCPVLVVKGLSSQLHHSEFWGLVLITKRGTTLYTSRELLLFQSEVMNVGSE